MKSNHKKLIHKHVDKKLIFRLRLFFVIFVGITLFVIYDVIQLPSSILFAVVGYIIGSLVGFVASRMFNIVWHEKKEKVVSKLDAVGIVILILYFVIALGRNYIAGYFFTGQLLTVISFSLVAGIMLGRLVGTGLKVRNVLLSEGKIKQKKLK